MRKTVLLIRLAAVAVLISFGAVFQAAGAVLMEVENMAKKGDADAQFSLGCMYYEGEKVSANHREALKWFLKAAEQGHGDAQFGLGTMYYNGEGTPIDYEKAMEWFLKAAGQGNAAAQYQVGLIYFEGKSIPADYVKSYAWSTLSAEQGNEAAKSTLKYLAGVMTPKQIAAAQKEAAGLGKTLRR